MPAERVAMRQVREIIRLKFSGQRRDTGDRTPPWLGGLDNSGDVGSASRAPAWIGRCRAR